MLPLLFATSFAHATEWTPESKKVVYVQREQSMSASPESCMAVATDFDGWKNWTAWNTKRDPEATWTYTDVDGMVGDEMTWSGPELDTGRTVITGYTAPASGGAGVMDFTTYFGEDQTPSLGRITCAPAAGGGTLASWEFQMEAGFMTRLFRGAIEKAIGGDFTVGLAGLATTAAEFKLPEPPPAPEPVMEASEAVEDASEAAQEAAESASNTAEEAEAAVQDAVE